jgi:hypothetical protein
MNKTDSDFIKIFQALPKDAQHDVFRFLSGSNAKDELSTAESQATLHPQDATPRTQGPVRSSGKK